MLAAERADCRGSLRLKGFMKNPDACAQACRGTSEMFAFGKCNGLCNCECKLNTNNYQCAEQYTSNEFNLYKFKSEGTLAQLEVKYRDLRYPTSCKPQVTYHLFILGINMEII